DELSTQSLGTLVSPFPAHQDAPPDGRISGGANLPLGTMAPRMSTCSKSGGSPYLFDSAAARIIRAVLPRVPLFTKRQNRYRAESKITCRSLVYYPRHIIGQNCSPSSPF